MELHDLFPPREVSEKGAKRFSKTIFNNDAMKCLEHELTIVALASKNMPLNDVDQARFELAKQRIEEGLAYAKS